MEPGILEGVRVVDMAEGLAGSVAALLLAEAGADVVKVETPGGEAGPSIGSETGTRTWNRSKRRVPLDPTSPDGRRDLGRLLDGADVLIHELSPIRAAALDLDDATLSARHPRLVVSSVLAWPANHPDSSRPVDELLAMARLGVCDEQRAMRRDGPVLVRFPLGSWGAVYLAAAGITARLLARGRTGRGGGAHTSLVQGALVPMGMHWSRAESPSPAMAYGMPKETGGSQASLFECSDGVWIHLMKCPDTAPMMKAALESMGEAGAAEANASVVASPFGYPNLGANIAAFKTRPSSEWLADLWANDIPVQPAQSFGEVFADEQARANTYVVDVEDPEVGTITAGGLPLTVTPPTRVRFARPATTTPAAEVIEQWSPRAESAEVGRSLRWPLEGLKVLDLGNYLAGPYGPMVMADMGADVIKIESTAGDAMRPTGWAFAGCQRGKRSISLDLKDPVARPALEALIRWADVVHHNVRMPAAYRIGIDYESVRALNPNVIYCHTSSYGPVGPRADWPGYDQLFQAFCGWEVLGAGEGNPPMWHRFGFMDHQCALSSVVATLLALLHRERTGEGQAVAGSLLGAGALTTSESHLLADGSLAPIAGLNSDQTKVRPGYEILELADGWVAVACHTSAQLHSYCQVAGVTDPGQAPAALRTRFQSDVLAALEEAKVPSEPVRLAQRYPFFDDAANQAAGLVATYQSAEFGKLEQPGALWYFGDMDVRLEMAPPALGEHTVEILRSVGFDDHQIEVLLASGAAKAFAPDAS